jgi:lipoate---protein ligase
MAWEIIVSDPLAADAVMAKDARLLSQLDRASAPILHFYEWKRPSVTYGYFTDPSRHLQEEALLRHGVDAAKRPTGGGVIFHLTDLAFSVLLPASHSLFSLNTLANYAAINRLVAEAVIRFTEGTHQIALADNLKCEKQVCSPFCMAQPTVYDLLIEGRKVGGAAQRRTQNGLLHQGSISLAFPPQDLLMDVLLEGEQVANRMRINSFCLLPEDASRVQLTEARAALRRHLITLFA